MIELSKLGMRIDQLVGVFISADLDSWPAETVWDIGTLGGGDYYTC